MAPEAGSLSSFPQHHGIIQQHSSGNNPVLQGTPPAPRALGDASESRIRAAACDQLASVDRAWDLVMDALQLAVL